MVSFIKRNKSRIVGPSSDRDGVVATVQCIDCGLSGIDAHCNRCGGSGRVPAQSLAWLERGELLRQQRLDSSVGLGEMANVLGFRPAHLFAIEAGVVPNLHVEYPCVG